MENIDIKLYRLKIMKGKEEVAKEWLNFLKDNRGAAIKTLKNEKVYLESYFSSVEENTMYIHVFIAANDIAFANNIAGKSENSLDQKHFEYMKSCVDIPSSAIIDCFCYLDNLSDLNS